MENKNGDFRNKSEKKEEKVNNSFRHDFSNESRGNSEEKLLDSNSADNHFAVGNLDNPGEKEENLRKKILNENKNESLGNIAKNISSESKGIDKLATDSNKNLFTTDKKKNKDLTMPIIVVITVLVMITGIAAYYFLRDKEFGNKPENSQQIIKSSMKAMSNVESYDFKGNIDFNIIKDTKEEFSLTMKFDGKTDEKDSNNIKNLLNVKPLLAISREGGNEEISFNLSMMSFNEDEKEIIYLKLNDFDLGAMGMMYGEAIIPYKNNWYFLDIKESQSDYPIEKYFSSKRITGNVKKLLKKYDIIKFQKDLGDIKLGNTETYHYKVVLDSESLLSFYVELFKTTPFQGFSERDIENFETKIKTNKAEIMVILDEIMNNTETEIWIGKDDNMIYKMSISGEFDKEFMFRLREKINKINQKEKSIIKDNYLDESSFSFYITVAMSNFNKPVKITKPEKTEDLRKVVKEMFNKFIGGMMISGVDYNLDSDMDGLNDNIEKIYGTDKNNPDTDGDGYKDGEEVKNGYDPIIPGDAKLDYDKLFNTR